MGIKITSLSVTLIPNLAVFSLERKTPPTTCSRQTLLLWKTQEWWVERTTTILLQNQLSKWHQHQDQLLISPCQTEVPHHDALKCHPVVHLRKCPMLIFLALQQTLFQTQTCSVASSSLRQAQIIHNSSLKRHHNLIKCSNSKTLQVLVFSLRMLDFMKILKWERDQINFNKTLHKKIECSWVDKTKTWEQMARLPQLHKIHLLTTTMSLLSLRSWVLIQKRSLRNSWQSWLKEALKKCALMRTWQVLSLFFSSSHFASYL